MTEPETLAFERRCLAAREAGAIGVPIAALFTPDVAPDEFPNRLVPAGRWMRAGHIARQRNDMILLGRGQGMGLTGMKGLTAWSSGFITFIRARA